MEIDSKDGIERKLNMAQQSDFNDPVISEVLFKFFGNVLAHYRFLFLL